MEQRNNLVLQGTETFSRGALDNVALESGVQECIESLQDLKANNAEEIYLKGLNKK